MFRYQHEIPHDERFSNLHDLHGPFFKKIIFAFHFSIKVIVIKRKKNRFHRFQTKQRKPHQIMNNDAASNDQRKRSQPIAHINSSTSFVVGNNISLYSIQI